MTSKAKIHPYLMQLIKKAIKKGASDLHLKVNIVPVIRVLGKLRPLSSELPSLSSHDIEEMINDLLDERQTLEFEKEKEVDVGFGIPGVGRFRFNVFRQRGTSRMVIRNIPHVVPSLKDLRLPSVVQKIAGLERGLVLVTGATGSGKSTTMASMVDHINRSKNKHIITIEDPIEYLIRDRKSIITQRELGLDAHSFSRALRAALRQDPDIILIGEMRDKETIETALLAAETGHLVLSTMHTVDARETINRILAVFEPHQQFQVRLQLGSVLKAVVSQRLATRKDKRGYVPAAEIMLNTARIREMIEDPTRTKDIPVAITEGRTTYGMQTFDQALLDLVKNKIITTKTALEICSHPDDFKVLLSGLSYIDNNQGWDQATNANADSDWDNISDVSVQTMKTGKAIKKKKA